MSKIKKSLEQRGMSQTIENVLLGIAEEIHKKFWVSRPAEVFLVPGPDMLVDLLHKAGIASGDTVMCHSSWDSLRFAFASPNEVIDTLLDYLGPEGTLAMPAIPAVSVSEGVELNLDRAVSRAGLISEVFRRRSGVTRSVNLNHSVCAVGPRADFLTREHQMSATSWDSYSPYRRIADISEAWVVGFGVGLGLRAATSLHCVESELIDKAYFARLFTERFDFRYVSRNHGRGEAIHTVRRGANFGPKIARYFSPDELFEFTLSGIDFYAIRAEVLVYKAIELGRRGKTMYFWPIPWPWMFR